MSETRFCGRRAVVIENDNLRVTVLKEGGHIAEIFDKRAGVSPLWVPPWASIEPSCYDPKQHPEYGSAIDAKLLAGIMGHNVCLDIFGSPSDSEFAAGMTPHGEGSVVPYEIDESGGQLTMQADLPLARIHFQRRIILAGNHAIKIIETVESLCAFDRPIGWTQHVTLGPPFLETGITQFRASAGRSKVFESVFGSAAYLKTGAKFEWPMAPRSGGGTADLQSFNDAPVSSGYTAHLMNDRRRAFFIAFSPTFHLAFGYVWNRADFPWMGIWEENHSRTNPPWNGKTLTRGMEFGVSPMPESRREMVDRGRLFDVPAFRWLPARARIEVEYYALVQRTDLIPEVFEWPKD